MNCSENDNGDKTVKINEPRCEKTGFLHMRKNKDADQLRGNRDADQAFVFATRIVLLVTSPLLPQSEISSV